MTSFNSISDLSRSFQLRIGQSTLKNRLDQLTQEMTTGVKSDIAGSLGGDLSRISHIETRLTMLTTYQRNASEAESILDGMQSVLEAAQVTVDDLGPRLLSEANTLAENTLRMRAGDVEQQFRAMVNSMNTSIGGRYLFSGSRVDSAPLRDFESLLAGLNAAVGTATTAADIAARIDAWFDAPTGSGGFADAVFQGDESGNVTHSVSPDIRIDTGLNAATAELRDTFKGMAILTFAAQAGPAVDSDTLRALFTDAGTRLARGSTGLTAVRAEIGQKDAALAQAQVRNFAEASALTIARSTLTSADPFETATALQEVEARIQGLYTLTARLSRLSLTDYLK